MLRKPRYKGALAMALRRHIAQEDPDFELLEREELPLGSIWSKSIDEFVDERKILSNSHPELNAASNIAIRTLTMSYAYKCFNDLSNIMRRCESPIEAIVLAAIVTLCSKKHINLRLTPHYEYAEPYNIMDSHLHLADHYSSRVITIYPQAPIGNYRVDFLLEYEFFRLKSFGNWSYVVKNDQRLASPDLYDRIGSKIVVEADGHDYHERTKSQAIYDRRKDRQLQLLGFKVFRFTGSEINRDALACAEEIFRTFDRESGIEEIQPHD